MWGDVTPRQDGEAVLLDAYDQSARPRDETSHVHAVWRSVGVAFHTVRGAPQELHRPDCVTSPRVCEAHGELGQPPP